MGMRPARASAKTSLQLPAPTESAPCRLCLVLPGNVSGRPEPTAPRESDAILSRLLDLHPKAIDLSLGRMIRLLDALGNPERAMPPVIHVAGTNGKGSVVAFLDAMLRAAGYRVNSLRLAAPRSLRRTDQAGRRADLRRLVAREPRPLWGGQ